jgi:CO/xanthine dehydrogenase Mo-binding subunit
MEIPPIEVVLAAVAPSPRNPLGIKGAGEGGTVGVGGAVAGAVADALGIGAELRQLPLTPERVHELATLSGRAGERSSSNTKGDEREGVSSR